MIVGDLCKFVIPPKQIDHVDQNTKTCIKPYFFSVLVIHALDKKSDEHNRHIGEVNKGEEDRNNANQLQSYIDEAIGVDPDQKHSKEGNPDWWKNELVWRNVQSQNFKHH